MANVVLWTMPASDFSALHSLFWFLFWCVWNTSNSIRRQPNEHLLRKSTEQLKYCFTCAELCFKLAIGKFKTDLFWLQFIGRRHWLVFAGNYPVCDLVAKNRHLPGLQIPDFATSIRLVPSRGGRGITFSRYRHFKTSIWDSAYFPNSLGRNHVAA